MKNGVSGYFFSPSVRDVWFHRFQWQELHKIATAHSADPDHEPKRPREGITYQFLRKWSEDERKKFGLEIKTPEKKQEVEKTQTPPAATVKDDSSGFDMAAYLEDLKQKNEPANVFDKIKHGKGEAYLDEVEAALKEMGFQYKD